MKITRKTTFRILSGALVVGLLAGAGAVALHAQADAGKAPPTLDDIQKILSDPQVDAQKRIDAALAAIGDMRDAQAAPDQEASPPVQDPWASFAFPDDTAFGFGSTWDPLAEMQRMRAMTDQMFNGALARMNHDPTVLGGPAGRPFAGRGFAPATDVLDKGDAYELRFELPGVDKTDVSLEVKDGRITVKGTRNATVEERGANGQTIRRESSFGSFHRTVPLPGPVDEAGIAARQENGVLVVTLPKPKEAAADGPRKIPIE